MADTNTQSVPEQTNINSVLGLHTALNDEGYICDRIFASKVMTSINTKPVSGAFLYGMAGTGKSYLPMVLAKVLERQLFVHQCTQGTREEDLLVKIMPSEDTTSGVKIGHGKIFQAALESRNRPVMLMLDEWDKTRPSVDGFFLDFLQYGRLSLPGVEDGEIQANLDNLTIFITANDEREFHEALLRRFPMIHVNPIEPADVVSALKLTHKDNLYIPHMLDLYTRSIQAKMPKPATIQELRQLMDAIDCLDGDGDWDALVYQYITKTPENHILLAEQKKVTEIDIPSICKIDADDYGVDVVPERNINDEGFMPDLREMNEFDSSFEKVVTTVVPENTSVVLERTEGSQHITDNMMMSQVDSNDPELAAMPDWGVITENHAYIHDDITVNHALFIDKVTLFRKLKGEVRIVDKYISREEVNRMLRGKWNVHKRDVNEVIARLRVGSGNKIDMRYTEGRGLEIISPTDRPLCNLFRLNRRDNVAMIDSIEKADERSLELLSYHTTPSCIAVADLYRTIVEGITTVGNSVLKSMSEHDGFCRGLILHSPYSQRERCDMLDIPFIDELLSGAGKDYKVKSMQDGFVIVAKNIDFIVTKINDNNHGMMKMNIDGYVTPKVMAVISNWIPHIPLYKCFQHDGTVREKLEKTGWRIWTGNVNVLHKNGIYAYIVYDYVMFCSFMNDSNHDYDSLSLDMKSKINRMKALEKAHRPNQ